MEILKCRYSLIINVLRYIPSQVNQNFGSYIFFFTANVNWFQISVISLPDY